MAKTIHTQAEPDPELKKKKMILAAAQMDECSRGDAEKATIKFVCALGNNIQSLFAKMKWQVPENHTTLQKLEGKLSGSLVLRAEDKLVEAELALEFKTMTSFQCLRLELERKKGKGFRRELRFTVTTEEIDALAKIEAYMTSSNNARGSLEIDYIIEPEQTTIGETRQDSLLAADDPGETHLVIGDPEAAKMSEIIEQSKAAGSLASAREMNAGKRKRLADKDVQ